MEDRPGIENLRTPDHCSGSFLRLLVVYRVIGGVRTIEVSLFVMVWILEDTYHRRVSILVVVGENEVFCELVNHFASALV